MAERFVSETLVIFDCGHIKKVEFSPSVPVSIADDFVKVRSEKECPGCKTKLEYWQYADVSN